MFGKARFSTPTGRDIECVLPACIRGEEAAWRSLDAWCRAMLPTFIRDFRLPAGWAGELVPDFLCHLFEDRCHVLRAYEPRPPARFESWIRVCFRRYTLRWLRNRSLPHWDPSVDPTHVLDEGSAGRTHDPAVLLGFSHVLGQLSDREGRLLALCVEQRPYAEIGQRLGMKDGAVAVAVQRLRERVRVLLDAQVLDLGVPRPYRGREDRVHRGES